MNALSGRAPRELARRRWAAAAWLYGLLLALGVAFVGVIYVGFVASLKTDPLEQPFSLSTPQLNPTNWLVAARLGRAGAGNRWLGGFGPAGDVTFRVQYFVPAGASEPLRVSVPKRNPGSRIVTLRPPVFAADFAETTVTEVVGENLGRPDPETAARLGPGVLTNYDVRVRATGSARYAQRLPLDIETPRGYVLTQSTLPPDRIERRGRVASWDTLTPGVTGYVLKNYVRAFRESYDDATSQSLLWRWTLNTFVFAAARVLAALLFASMAGYALARLRFPGRRGLFVLVLFSMTIPVQVTFISNYLVLRDGIFGLSRLFGADTLLNSLAGLVVGGSGSTALVGASAVFIMKQFFESVPRELEEAAELDGAGVFTTFFRIILPVATPALGALTILTFQGAWNDFFWPLVVMTSRDNITLPVGLLTFSKAYGPAGDWGLVLASAFFSVLPVVVLFAVFQRYFIEGVSFSGLKG